MLKLILIVFKALFKYLWRGAPKKSWTMTYFINVQVIKSLLDGDVREHGLQALHRVRARVAKSVTRSIEQTCKTFNGMSIEPVSVARQDEVLNRLTNNHEHFRTVPRRVMKEDMYGEIMSYDDSDTNDTVILYMHGGAHVMMNVGSHRLMAGRMCEKTRFSVMSIEYRLAPENPFPSALFDCFYAYLFLIERGFSPSHIVLMGDSAGGHLGLTLMLFLKEFRGQLREAFGIQDLDLPRCACFYSPWCDLTGSLPSYWLNDGVDYLENARNGHTKQVNTGYLYYLGLQNMDILIDEAIQDEYDPEMAKNPYICPALAGDFTEMPPTLLQCGSSELLLSDTLGVFLRSLEQTQNHSAEDFRELVSTVTSHVIGDYQPRTHTDSDSEITSDIWIHYDEWDFGTALHPKHRSNILVQVYHEMVHAFQAFPNGPEMPWALNQAKEFLMKYTVNGRAAGDDVGGIHYLTYGKLRNRVSLYQPKLPPFDPERTEAEISR